jgi:hypothetical protein
MDQHKLARRRAQTARARDVWWAHFLDEVDPRGELALADRVTRALEARRRYYVEIGKLGGRPKRAQQVVR